MLETAIITFREGLEMFLIIAIMLAYLTRTGRNHLKEPVYWGGGVAAVISLTTGWHIADMAEDPFMEGSLALAAGVLVATMTYTVMKASTHIRTNINNKLEAHAQKEGWSAILGIFCFTVLMITREGMETAMMLGTMTGTMNQGNVLAGAFLGLASVAAIGWFWVKNATRINLRLFMQATGIFLMLFCVHLFLYGFHELTEIGAFPLIDNFKWHTLTEPFEPGEPIGNLITFGLLAVPALWIIYSYGWNKYIATRYTAAAE